MVSDGVHFGAYALLCAGVYDWYLTWPQLRAPLAAFLPDKTAPLL